MIQLLLSPLKLTFSNLCLICVICNFPDFVLTDFIFSTLCLLQNVREPSGSPQAASSATSVPKSGSYGMIQYLQSWFPGWGGWSGNTQNQDTPEELLPSPSSWDILG